MDFSNVEKIGPDYWRNSQLSVARFSGAIILQGRKYILCPLTDYLVREDIWNKELKANKQLAADVKKAAKLKWDAVADSMSLFGWGNNAI